MYTNRYILFLKTLTETFNIKSRYNITPSWFEIFSELKSTNEKMLIIIDEFPYIVKGNKSVPSIIQELWDMNLKDKDILLVLSGSSMSFIENEILSAKNPLYGRTTGIYKLTEFNSLETIGFFPEFPLEDRVYIYSLLGGVPHYLNMIERDKSLQENIIRLFMDNASTLYTEPEFLLRQELREPATYYSIIEAIALGMTRLNEISTKTGIDKTILTSYIKNLINLNIIQKEFSIGISSKKKISNSQGLYTISTNFFKAYFKFVYPYANEIEQGLGGTIYQEVLKNSIEEYTGRIFECICMDYLIKMNKDQPIRFVKIGRWWDKAEEIHIVAKGMGKQYIFGECKWRNRDVDMSVLENLKRKAAKVAEKNSEIFYYLFSKSGFKEDVISEAGKDKNIKLITFENMM